MNKLNCTLNSTYLKLLKKTRFKYTTKLFDCATYDGRSYKAKLYGFIDEKTQDFIVSNATSLQNQQRTWSCCGISEFNMEKLDAVWKTYKDDKDWPELVAQYLYQSHHGWKDKRVYIVGLPIKVSRRTSQYTPAFYQSLYSLFKEWGFVELSNKPYKNQNSNNTIVVLACQLP